MFDPSDTPRFAPIEDLDPEPARRSALAHRWEWGLGVLLVLLVAGFAGAQWWVQQGQLTHYRTGVAAAARYDWPAAAVAFAAAGSYSDAVAQARNATALAAERDQKYTAAAQAIAGADWPAALAALQRVDAITPGYRDTARLLPEAAGAVYPQALTDTVVLRAGANPPGLYTYGGGAWHYLPGSDAQSQVLAACPAGGALYDGPDPAATATPGTGTQGSARGQRYAGRRLLVGLPGAIAGSEHAVTLDPAQFDQFVCVATGVWGLGQSSDVALPDTSPALVPTTHSVAFQPFDRPVLTTPRLPGAGWLVLDVTPDGEHLLIAQVGGSTLQAAQIHLALFALDGSVQPLMDSAPGPLLAEHVSPDSRYLVLTFLHVVDAEYGTRRTVLVDTRTGTSTILVEIGVDWRATPSQLWTADPFLLHGPRANQVVVTATDAGHEVVRLIDPAHPATPVAQVTIDNGSRGLRFPDSAPADAGMLFNWVDLGRAGAGPPGFMAYLDPSGKIAVTQPAIDPNLDLWYTWLRGPYFVHEIRDYNTTAAGTSYTLAIEPRTSPNSPTITPTVIYSGTLARGTYGASGAAPTVYLGPNLLTYITASGDLHARTYDGAVDLLLDRDVRAIYPRHPGDTP